MMLKSRRVRIGAVFFPCLFFSLFAACGGGGGSEGPTVYLNTTVASWVKSVVRSQSTGFIADLGATVLEKGGLVNIRGQGFAGGDSVLDNEVYFLDQDGFPFSASIVTSSQMHLSAHVPPGLQLNDSSEPETNHLGSTYVYVELSDGSQSNPVWLSVVPEPPKISPDPAAGQMEYKGTKISMFQARYFPIYYTVNDSIECPCNGPFDLGGDL